MAPRIGRPAASATAGRDGAALLPSRRRRPASARRPELPPAAASTSTWTSPRTRCSHGACRSTPRMRSSGTTRVVCRNTPRSITSRPASMRYVNRRHSATSSASPAAASTSSAGIANPPRQVRATIAIGRMLWPIRRRAKTRIASGCSRPVEPVAGSCSVSGSLTFPRRSPPGARAPRRARRPRADRARGCRFRPLPLRCSPRPRPARTLARAARASCRPSAHARAARPATA